jgi:putative peptidoglycan lipid II flippase
MGSSISVVRSSLVFSGFTLISRFLGLARDLVLTAIIGASGNMAADAYQTALQFPNLFRRIFAEGAFSAAFVPAYSQRIEAEGKDSADQLARDAMATLAAITIALCLLFQALMPWIMQIYSSGYADDPAKMKLTILLTQITMPYLPAMTIVAMLSGVLNAKGRFILSAVAPSLLNLIMLLLVLPQKSAEAAAMAASIGVALAGAAQVGLLWWGTLKSGARIFVVWPSLPDPVRKLLWMAAPGAFAASATQINVFVSSWLASGIDGARVWLSVADRLYQLPLGLVGVAIGVALLPSLSRSVAADDKVGAQNSQDQAILMSMIFTFPATAALLGMPHFMIDALFGRGQFNQFDVTETAKALFHYGWGVPAFVLSRVLNPAFFARMDTKSPMRFALIGVIINLVIGLLLFPILGVSGLAIGTSAAAWVNVILMWVTLTNRGHWALSNSSLISLFKCIIGLLFITGFFAFCQISRTNMGSILVIGALPKEFLVVLLCFLSLFLYMAILFGLKAISVADIKAALKPKAKLR